MNLGKKIRIAREEQGLSQSDLAFQLGVTARTLQNYEYETSIPDIKIIQKMAKILNSRIEYFLDENFDVSTDVSNKKNFDVSSQKDVVSPSNLKKSHEQPNIISIPYFEDTYASAGNGVINYDEAPVIMDFDEEFLRMFLRISGNIANMHIINSRGDSMEPTIASGELLFINPMQNENGLISGCIYIISYEGDIFVKRVEKNPVTKAITLFSDNEKYKPIVIEKHNLDQCYIMGRVVSQMKRV